MSRIRRAVFGALTAGAATLLLCWGAGTAASATAAKEPTRDGGHDFDFNFGVWTTHIRRLAHPLSGSKEYIELNGTVSVRKVWDGRAQLEEIETDGPNGHWQGMTLFLYNPASHQWSQSFVNSASGQFAQGTIGSFKNGRGELYSQDTYDGRSILVRGLWSDITPNAHRYEEDYSDDGGKSWEAVFLADLTRKASGVPSEAAAPGAQRDGSHDFDFDIGSWKTHSRRLLHPLSGANDWVDMDGATVVSKVWGGKANLAEFQADGAAGPVELMALRIYDPKAHQWSINFATPNVGTLGVPGVGEVRDGRMQFLDQESINGRAVLVRFEIWSINPTTAQSEQAFSDDGGKTWEVNWINQYTRIG